MISHDLSNEIKRFTISLFFSMELIQKSDFILKQFTKYIVKKCIFYTVRKR